MLPVPFAGHLGYDAIFIVTYAAWLLFEIITGKARKSSDPKKARDRGSFRFLIIMIWAGIALAFTACFGLQQAAIPWMRTELFLAGIALMWAGIAFRYYAMRAGALFYFSSGRALGTNRNRSGAVSLHPASFVYRRADYSAGPRPGAGKLGGDSRNARVHRHWIRLPHPRRGSRADRSVGRALQGLYETHAAARAVRSLIGERMLAPLFLGFQRRRERGQVSGSLNHGHRADLRQFLHAELQLAGLA